MEWGCMHICSGEKGRRVVVIDRFWGWGVGVIVLRREREREKERESDEEQRHFFFFWVWKRKEFEILREVFGGVESCLGIHEMRWNIYVLNRYIALLFGSREEIMKGKGEEDEEISLFGLMIRGQVIFSLYPIFILFYFLK